MLNLQRALLIIFGILFSVSALLSNARPATVKWDNLEFLQEFPSDTTTTDTLKADTLKVDSAQDSLLNQPYEPSKRSTFRPFDRYGDPISNRTSPSPLLLKDPAGVRMDVKLDTGYNLKIDERVGDNIDYRPGTRMSFEQYAKLQEDKMLKGYWKSRAAGLDGESPVSGRGLIPPIYMSPVFDRVFGGSYVNIIPSGYVTLDFSTKFLRTYNPEKPVSQQRQVIPLEFDQQISMNVVGKVGEKLQVNANFDNNSTFDFQNNLKVEYTGFEEEIIKKIEVGNVSLPVRNSLISGGQNLFGVKTELQFGRLFVTGIASTQRGKTESVEVEDGAQSRQFEMSAVEYDDNRHFFLGHFFRDNYEKWLSRLPQVISGVNVTRVEVYVLNRSNNTQDLRNVVGLTDLAEASNVLNPNVAGGSVTVAANNANDLFSMVSNGERNADNVVSALENSGKGLKNGTDFVKVNARRLNDNEFTVNKQLGYISLNRKLQADEILAVAYEYTYGGQPYKVGELSEDYSSIADDEVVFLKLLRPAKISTEMPTWDLMMKNIYALNASQITQDGFELKVIYKDDKTGQDLPQLQEGANIRNKQLVEVMGLDKLNTTNDIGKDGNFDFIEGVTINSNAGHIIFPVLEPFGTHLNKQFNYPAEAELIDKYVYTDLYEKTQNDAEQIAAKNKFFLKGKVQGGSSSEISLQGFNIAEGSVSVMAGNTVLNEGTDYTVDYQMGKVTILNQGILNSGQKIKVNYEKGDMFDFRTRTLVGTRLDYRFNEDMNLGATVLHLNEVPVNSRPNIGDEPNSNTKWGLDFNMKKDSRFLTKMVDKIPLIETKEPSSYSFSTEFAQLKPGTSNQVDGDGASYIDDFEQSAVPFSLDNNPSSWKLASVPATDDNELDPSAGAMNDIRAGYKRAKLSWYSIDNLFFDINSLGSGPGRPDNISDEDMKNHYARRVNTKEIFPYKEVANLADQLENTFDLAYYPQERGPYNYNPEMDRNGNLPNPEENWGGITRSITTNTDFDQNNIEYLEFWMMDPFIDSEYGKVEGKNNKDQNGKLVFNLGRISEDVVRDGRIGFENGIPEDGSDKGVIVNQDGWGKVSSKQNLTSAFGNTTEARENQDIGLDGLKNSEETAFFQSFLNSVSASGGVSEKIMNDPSGDNFEFYLSDAHDRANNKVLERYKNYRGHDGNSPLAGNSEVTPSNGNNPNNEDLNEDNILNEVEAYYEYEVDLAPGKLEVGQNNVVDKVTNTVNGDEVNWYLVRIPIRNGGKKVGDISGFKNIQFIRTYMTGFENPVVLRFAKFQLVGSQWRRYTNNLKDPGLNENVDVDNSKFNLSVVNIEENSQPAEGKSPYVLPPNIIRDRDYMSMNNVQKNEQSLQLCVEDLKDEDARAAFKNVDLDLVNYGRLKMFLHAESEDAYDDEVTAFVRFGTDFTDNYYEVEVPLKMTSSTAQSAADIWPEENEIDIAINDLFTVKSKRNQTRDLAGRTLPFTSQVGRYNVTVVGNPDMSAVQTVMIGVRNPESEDRAPKSVCIWANELRVAEFKSDPGYAANARMNVKLADFANISASTRYTSFGFGGIQQKISERSREEVTGYDVSANVNLDKFLPEESGIKVPMYLSYQNEKSTPKYDPRDPDTPLEASVEAIDGADKKEEYLEKVESKETRRSINFTNVRKERTNPEAKAHIYDIENFSLSYAYSDVTRSNIDTDSYVSKSYRGALTYDYAPKPVVFEPFKNMKAFNSPYLQLIKDFNLSLLPSKIAFRADIDRRFTRTQLRNQYLTTEGIDPVWEKQFNLNRQYNLGWNLTRSLSLDYSSRTNAQIDEPEGDLDTDEKKDEVLDNLKHLGRMKNYDQRIQANYKLPLDKLPLTNWINANANYSTGYTWRAGAIDEQDTLQMGNTIENNRQIGLSGKLDLVKLYNKVDYLKKINSAGGRRRRKRKDDKEKENKNGFVKGLLRGMMAVRSVNFDYNVSEGTMLPGFALSPAIMGMDSSFNAPGLPFLLGSQDAGIRQKAAENGWLVENGQMTQPFTQSRSVNLNLRATVEPMKDLSIQFDAKKTKTSNFQEVFKYDTLAGEHVSLTPSKTGNYKVSFLSIATAFGDEDGDNSAAFKKFEAYRDVMKNRLDAANQNNGSYNKNSQDVLIPAFLAAYSGKDPSKSSTSPFPSIPLPNWRVNYSGLSKIPALQKWFSSINLTHAYSSTYSVNNYSSSLKYKTVGMNDNVEDYPLSSQTENGSFVPTYIVDQVSISERFSPLIGINIRTRSRLTAKLEYKKERNLSLSMTNAEVTEQKNNDLVLDIGYTKANFKLPFRWQGRTISFKNDLTFRLGMTLRDSKVIQRELDGDQTITSGNLNFIMKPSISYVLNKRLNLQVYYERSLTEPKISTSFKTVNSVFGAQLRFSLSQ